jgi:hypothetical protein
MLKTSQFEMASCGKREGKIVLADRVAELDAIA